MSTEPGPSLRISFAVIAVAIVLAITGGVGTGLTFAHSLFTTPEISLPAHLHRHLDAGSYQIYQKVSAGRDATFPTTNGDFASLVAGDVSVRSATGEQVAIEPTSDLAETITRGSRAYGSAVQFHIDRSGDYAIDIRYSGGPPDVILGRTIGDTFRQSMPWLFTLGAGGLLGAVGLALLVIGIVRRNRASQHGTGFVPAYAAALPPPGWYPDPGGSGRQRWWDGTRWTDHVG